MTAISTTSCCPRTSPPDDFGAIEKKMQQIIKADEPFVREVVTIDQAKEIFADQRFKLEHIDDLADEQITIYRHGSFVDLCSGPHMPVCRQDRRHQAHEAGRRLLACRRKPRACCSASTARRFSRRPSLTSICTTSKRPRSAIIARSAARLDLFMMREEASGLPVLPAQRHGAQEHAARLLA